MSPFGPTPRKSKDTAAFVCASALSLLAASLPAQEESAAPTPPADLSGALYLDPWQIEKEFLVSPLALQQWLDLGLTAESMLTAEQREKLKPRIGAFFQQKCPVTQQDEPVEFTLDRIHFIEPTEKEFVLIEPEAVVSPAEIRISIVFAAPNKDLAHAIQLFWDLFPRDAPSVTVKVADALDTRSINLSKFSPAISVRGRYAEGARDIPEAPAAPPMEGPRVPWLSVLLLGGALVATIVLFRRNKLRLRPLLVILTLAGLAAVLRNLVTVELKPTNIALNMGHEEGSRIVAPLLRGVYHAFDYRQREEQYDVLSRVAGGEALTPIFLEVQRTLESRERDGSRVRVSGLSVDFARVSPLSGRHGFEAECAWEAKGRVGHWGHFHNRTNKYRAHFVVEPIEGSWKITALSLLDREREASPSP